MIQRKKKICKSCKTEQYIWAYGNCKDCHNKGLVVKSKPKKAIKYRRPNTGEKELFEEIWAERPHICFITGDIIHEPTPSVFAHVLPKGLNKYPLFKLYKENIVLLKPDIHTLYDHGTIEQRANTPYQQGWQKLYNLAEQLKEEYKERRLNNNWDF